MQPTRKMRRATRQRGFTLIEIMIVLAIIGLITSAIGVAVYKKYRDAQIKVTEMQVHRLLGDVGQFQIMKNRCPTVEDLVSEQVLSQAPRDAWGTPLVVTCPGEHDPDPADILSFGPDKKGGTVDDIKSWVH